MRCMSLRSKSVIWIIPRSCRSFLSFTFRSHICRSCFSGSLDSMFSTLESNLHEAFTCSLNRCRLSRLRDQWMQVLFIRHVNIGAGYSNAPCIHVLGLSRLASRFHKPKLYLRGQSTESCCLRFAPGRYISASSTFLPFVGCDAVLESKS